MVLCWLALPVFAFLSIFSVKYRKLTLDSLDCMFRTITLRKCKSGLDDKIRADIAKTFLKFSPPLARFSYRHYKILSWIILVIFLWSFYAGSVGTYNYIKYGNCNGPGETGFCIFDPSTIGDTCSEVDVANPTHITYPTIDGDDPIIGDPDAELTIIEFGCYVCEYTAKTEPTVKEILDHYQGRVNLQFKTFEIPGHALSHESLSAASCAHEQQRYADYHDRLMALNGDLNENVFDEIAQDLGLNMTQFSECMESDRHRDEIEQDTLDGIQAGVHGTPTFFVNKQIIVGSKPFKTFKTVIDRELEK